VYLPAADTLLALISWCILILQRNLVSKNPVLEPKYEARNQKSETISNVQNANLQNKISHRVATGVWYFDNLNFEFVSHFRDNAGRQASGNDTGVVEIRISNLARLT